MKDKIFRKENIPNILTVIRAVLVPIFMLLIIFAPRDLDTAQIVLRLVGALLFGLISLTDMLDGKIARKYNYVSDFGKFLDPLADKILVFGAMISLMALMGGDEGMPYVFEIYMVFALFIFFAREIAVTSLRLLFSNKGGHALAANFAGKVKTVSQIVFVLVALVEPILWDIWVLTFLSLAVMVAMTIISGIIYFKEYIPLIMGKNEQTEEAVEAPAQEAPEAYEEASTDENAQ
ncbi:MAG: CDP-diacylglycerol--glycerol-3-phosphate 3-phosphatidyltransferase [Clostridia bacterium]|nr:CDP-diacylglycerol--glycerol-3-phosphate 3-phosphatidyltransferase [Clostridia bacterium]MBQ5602766.1 CDP-diacylglycerol--glycerol-3-phosphate 3-phosphatidyltransferase [Clostridia bacterium]